MDLIKENPKRIATLIRNGALELGEVPSGARKVVADLLGVPVQSEYAVDEEVPEQDRIYSESANIDYASMKVAELRGLAKSREISGYSSMKKAELVAALS